MSWWNPATWFRKAPTCRRCGRPVGEMAYVLASICWDCSGGGKNITHMDRTDPIDREAAKAEFRRRMKEMNRGNKAG